MIYMYKKENISKIKLTSHATTRLHCTTLDILCKVTAFLIKFLEPDRGIIKILVQSYKNMSLHSFIFKGDSRFIVLKSLSYS